MSRSILTITPGADFPRTKEALRKMGARGRNLAPVLRGPISRSIAQFWRRVFASQGALIGRTWAPLKPVTILLRKRAGHGRGGIGGRGIGRDTNKLWASLTKPGGPNSIRLVTNSSLIQGSSLPQARFMQDGGLSTHFPRITFAGKRRKRIADVAWVRRKTPVKVPARPLLPKRLPDPLVKAWDRFIAKYILTGKKRG